MSWFSRAAHMRLIVCLAAAAAVLASAPVSAEMMATPLRGDSRLVEFVYDRDNTYLVLAKPKAVTHIQFAPDELIQSLAAGDTSAWDLTPTKNRRHLFVKPTYEDGETSLTVLTTKRSYQFVLRSTGDGKKWYQRVSWLYTRDLELNLDLEGDDVPPPAAASITVAKGPSGNAPLEMGHIDPGALTFGYEVVGDAPFRPRVVFDDGRFTYFKMPSSLQELPALFAVIDGQEFSLVNFEVKGDYLVAQRLLTSAVLKLGRAEVRVTKAAPKRIFNFGLEAP